MIITTTIDTNYLENDIDHLVKENLIEKLAERIAKQTDLTESGVLKSITDKLNYRMETLLNDIFNNPIVIRDKYGDPVQEYANLNEMLDEKFEKYLTENVDNNGKKTDSCSFGKVQTRISYILDKKVEKEAEKFVQNITYSTEREVKRILSTELTKQVKERLIENIGINEIVNQVVKPSEEEKKEKARGRAKHKRVSRDDFSDDDIVF